jgi:hypothetical protein
MPVTIDEVTAEVAAPDRGQSEPSRAEPKPSACHEPRKQRELAEHLAQRAARVRAD